ncbi:hypothetical protein [Paenibacillus sp. 1001270B_150601_E10]|uniref:hypothetical protein n=1 Tax=Paenibacillus sp. 1001270B_150601_E10 TaxID=2787079 RepID=UPI0018A03148|nr:hypothetical protein [Paenibacillus sp. 1001270B_150601_E10]
MDNQLTTESWLARIKSVEAGLTEESKALMEDLLVEIEQLQKQNTQLRKSLAQARQKSKMATKLKEALYE